jgi:hypothetical protein
MIPGVGPLAAAALVAGGSTLATGSLTKGLMMGLGAYGGAGLAGGIAKMGLGALAGEAAGAEGSALATQAARTTASTASSAFPNASQLSTLTEAGTPALTSGTAAAETTAQQVAKQGVLGTPQAPTFMGNLTNFPSNLTKAIQNPGQAMDAMGGPLNTAMYGGALVGSTLDPNMKYKMPNSAEDSGKDSGNNIRLAPDFYSRPLYSGAPNPISYPYKTHFNEGGIASLGAYSDGGQLAMGPGDGMSDSIPAMMPNGDAARLGDGEFVVPSDVVSGLGNGSTKSGTGLLYDMMDRVRRARTGTESQPREIASHRMMPA